MKKCNKVKNACKICLGPVSNKTGIQCQGACQSWVHFDCINYTPGKIKDIKAGIIKVSCPCPDCKTTLPKEYRTDEPFSCSNRACPANTPPKCGNQGCPTNSGKNADQLIQAGSGCALDRCGKGCKKHSHPQLPSAPSVPLVQPCQPPHYPFPVSPRTSASDACINYNKCPSGCSNVDVPGDLRRHNDSGLPSLETLTRMCDTVGKLTNQINDMMIRMKQAVQEGNPKCATRGPRSLCTKPCYCPRNPEC